MEDTQSTSIELKPSVIEPLSINTNIPNEVPAERRGSSNLITKKTDDTVEIDLDKVSELKASGDKSHRTTFDNKGFELEDISAKAGNPSGANANADAFNRVARPGSMISIRSNASTTSRTSVNCTTGRVKCPEVRLKKFFSYNQNGGFPAACEDIKKLILPEKDGNLIGVWLLIEISYWDLHREKMIMLLDKTLINVSYDFINQRILEYDRVPLADLTKVKYGNLTYPKSSYMGAYQYGAVKIQWGDDNLGFMQRWNPFGAPLPFYVLTSHHILYNEKEKETSIYNCDEFIASLEYAISKLAEIEPKYTANKIMIVEQEIEIPSYASLVSVLYNHNWLGFQLDRNGINF